MRKQTKLALKVAITGLAAAFLLTGCPGLLEEWLERNSDVTLSLTWEGDEDLDLYLTYPDPADNNTVDSGAPAYGSIADAYDPAQVNGDLGFYPEDGANRASVSYYNQASDDRDVIWADWSDDDANREAIYIDQLPFGYTLNSSDFNTTPNSNNALPSLPPGYSYAWVGVLEGYVWGYNSDASDADEVKLQVYNEDDRMLGEFVLPQEMMVKGASLVRIPVFQVQGQSSVVYQILAHTQLINDTSQIRSMGDLPTVGDYTVLATVFAEVE